ncbi:Exportin-1 (Exp1) (Chromosome region maintenance 1 protein homolog) [Durusdinium trenchii]|uniref:Exportin-1 (Exp1) (Chromosome region maintenance 1 protein homolog) n=1 Tax=Durusdinium trenchii TaxID=1381693 RepID=A0ABP0HFX1_9DINO
MEQLLDFSRPIDVKLLEQVVLTLNTSPNQNERVKADQVLTALKEHPDSWKSAGSVLETTEDVMTKYFALQIMEDTIKFRWKALPNDQREGIRNYVVKKIIALTSSDGFSSDRGQKVFVNKLNLILVHVLKQEWPHNWPNFIPEIVNSSKQSEILCENNMNILKLLSEEVFDFSKEEMTTDKVKKMKNQLNEEFRQIFDLCQLVLNSSQRPGLITATLQTLLRFLAWIPLGYIFETPLVEQLMTKFLPNNQFRNDTLACLTEIASLQESKYDTVFLNMFQGVMNLLAQQLPPETDIPREYENAGERECTFIRGLSLFFSSFFFKHLDLLERPEMHKTTEAAMFYLVSISMVDDKEIFAICLEYWNKFSRDLYESERREAVSHGSVLQLGNGGAGAYLPASSGSARKHLYKEVLSRLRTVMISKMAKPEEVLVVEGDDGTIVRETTKDTDAVAQYKTMRDTLVFLTHLDYEDTEKIMLAKLWMQCEEQNEFSWHSLNTLCWAIGSISGAMNEEDEKRFLVIVIKDLLSLCERKRGKDNKAVVASNIMYVVGQYPRFLRAHWKFLKTVVNKQFEFMHEPHPGVQDMACDTFLKIAQKCRTQFVGLHPSETRPFIDELLDSIHAIVNNLSPHQRHTFFEAVGYMVREQQNEQIRNQLLERLMSTSTQQWKEIMQLGNQNPQALSELPTITTLADVLHVNVRVCSAMGYSFRPHLMRLYLDMLHVYKFYSGHISDSVKSGGEIVIQHKNLKVMRVVKVETLRLIETFVAKSENSQDIANNFCPPLLEPVLGDYNQSVPAARNPEVIQLFMVIVNKLKNEAAIAMNGTFVEKVLAPIFVPTLEMITKNYTDFPEHRIAFFKLIKALNMYCFERLFDVPAETQKNIVDAIVWAFKHTERNIAETGLEILERLLNNVSGAPDTFAQGFYREHFLRLVQEILVVLTDRLHVASFTMHATILKQMFSAVQQGRVKVPLGPESSTNQAFLHIHVCEMIANAFPNVGKQVVEAFVAGLFDPGKDLVTYKTHVRDFLIRLKEFSADETVNQFYLQEKEEEQRRKQQETLQQRAAVPGLMSQQEKDEMADL